MFSQDTFKFLNISDICTSPLHWNRLAQEKLWLYNLHYFDDLNASGASERKDWHASLILRWITDNPPAYGIGWDSYPTSLRIVNWIKWLVGGGDPVPGMLRSLFFQSHWLSNRLERHLLGNHLFANAKALIFTGLFFQGERGSKWLESGLKIVSYELSEQVLPDGGHFERSPMYHAIFLEDLLDLINSTRYWPGLIPSGAIDYWRETAERMAYWLQGMTHPDGEISFFNDSAIGIACKPSELLSYAERLDLTGVSRSRVGVCASIITSASELQPKSSFVHYQDSGYVRLEGVVFKAFLDVAPVGPDYLPGHAHADTLSFELSVFSQRVIVNGGTSCYGSGVERLLERRTAAHSTVEIAGVDSSEVWGGFRVARRAYPFDLELQPGSGYVACSHNGYTRLPGTPVHRRVWQMTEDSFQVNDTVRGGKYTSRARYIFHPAIQVAATDTNTWHLTLAGGQRLRLTAQAGQGRIEPASYAPQFGKQVPTQSLVIELAAGVANLIFSQVK